jgi:DNA replication protein DnaC
MIDTETLTRLKAMRLSGMAQYFENLADTTETGPLTGPEMVKMAVDWEYERRRDHKLRRLRRKAALAQSDADIGDIKHMPGRTVDTELIGRLAVGSYLVKHQDVILQGPTGAGKTYIACALGNKACQQSRSVCYLTAGELFDRITVAERTDQKKRCLDALVKVELLIIDDWFLTTPSRQQVQQLHTLVDRRHKTASTIYCTQLPPANGTTAWTKKSSPTRSSIGSPPTRTPPSSPATTQCANTSTSSTDQHRLGGQ